MKKTILVLIVVVILLIAMSSTAFALYYPNSYYNAVSWTWSYSAPYTASYNCLGYATGSMTWEWPNYWNAVARQAEVDSYLAGLGYSPTTSHTSAWIISYGPSSDNIKHFSKVTGTSYCRAKWGDLERFNHSNHDPYYSSSTYGLLRRMYRQ